MSKRKMKDSGVEWLGEIPAEWDVVPARNLFSEVKDKNIDGKVTRQFSFRYGKIVDKDKSGRSDVTTDETITAYRIVTPDTIMINGLNLNYDFISQRVAIVEERGIITSAYLALCPNKKLIEPAFAVYLFKGYDSKQVFHGHGSGIRKTLNYSDFKEIKTVCPDLSTQRKIAAYLDVRCAKIDAMIGDAKKTIEEYKAWKASVIFEAVTGKNTGSKMKDSGVEWIGRMPDGWRVIPVRYLLVEKNVRSEAGLEEPLSMSQVHGVVPSKMITVANPASSYVGAKVVSVGDLVFNKLKAHLGVFAISRYAGLVSPDYAVYQSRGICDMSLLMWAFHTPQCISEFKKNVTGIGAGLSRLYTSDLYRIKVPVPSVEEQLRLVDFLDKKCAAIDRVISAKESLIADLEAYKKSLIFECVTGKMEVA